MHKRFLRFLCLFVACVNFARLVRNPMTYRALSAQALAEEDYDAFLSELQKSLTDGRRDPNEVVRDTLFEIYYGASQTNRENLSLAARAAYHSLDPRNIATEPDRKSTRLNSSH